MDDQQLQAVIDQLDAAVPHDGARVQIEQVGGGPDESVIVANRAGYLRFGIELLKAAYAPAGIRGNADAIEVDIDYLLTDDSDVSFDGFERRDPAAPRRPFANTDWIVIVMFLVMAAILGLTIVGMVTTFHWLRSF